MSSEAVEKFKDNGTQTEYVDNTLTQDKVQSLDEIKSKLNYRVRPAKIAFKVDQNIKYTIEDVYKNELENRLKQIEADMAREKVFVDERIGKKDETFYKGNDTYLTLLRSEERTINSLLVDLEDHKLFVKIEFGPEKVRFIGQKEKQVKRDGVYRTEIYPLKPMEVENSVLEDRSGGGYKLSIERMKSNEDAFHDKKMLQLKAKKEDEKAADDQQEEAEEEGKVEENVEEQQPQKEVVEPVKEEKQQPKTVQSEKPVEKIAEQLAKTITPKTVGIEKEGIQNIINNLGDFKSDQVFKQSDEDWLDKMLDDVLADAELSDADFASVLGDGFANQQIQQTATSQTQQNPQTVYQGVDSRVAFAQKMQNQAQQQIQAQQEKKNFYMTEHEMKIQNFKQAAGEIKQKMLKYFGGDEAKAMQNADYASFIDFVKNKIADESQKDYSDQEIEDWNLEENREYMEEDLDAKRSAFQKRYGNEFFANLGNRTQGPGF